MQGVFGAIKEISNCLSISSGLYNVFRPYYVRHLATLASMQTLMTAPVQISAIFRTIVDDSSLVFDSTTQILKGVLFEECVAHNCCDIAQAIAYA
jgi:hypothetical protein